MNITEKAAYIKGLLEGLDIDKNDKNVKVLCAIADLLEDLAVSVADLEDSSAALQDYVEEIDEDLGYVEEDLYGDEDGDGCDCGCEQYKMACPNCGEELLFTNDMIIDGVITCPSCNEVIDLDSCDDDCECDCCKN